MNNVDKQDKHQNCYKEQWDRVRDELMLKQTYSQKQIQISESIETLERWSPPKYLPNLGIFYFIFFYNDSAWGYMSGIHTVAYMTLIHGMYPSNIIQLKYI